MLKKLNVNPNPEPLEEITLNTQEPEDIKIDTKIDIKEDIKVPLARIGSRTSMRTLNGFDEKRKAFKHKLFYNTFINDMNEQLGMLQDMDERKYSYETVQFVAQACEDEFIQEKNMSQMKHDCVVEVCKKYFNDDIELVEAILNQVMPRIIQSHFLRRLRLKSITFFCHLLKALVALPTP